MTRLTPLVRAGNGLRGGSGGGGSVGIDPNTLATNTAIDEITITATDITSKVFVNMNVKKISAPNVVILTGATILNGATYIEELDFPELVQITGTNALINTSTLSTVNFPKLEKTGALLAGTGVVEANLPKLYQTGGYMFNGCTKLVSAYLPAYTRIRDRDFYNCTALKTVDFGENSTATSGSIAGASFNNCAALETLIIHTPYVCSLDSTSAFTGCTSLAHIYVPADLVDTYKAATNWTTYEAIISAIPA